jgi:myo-inositol-1(or 4)-monophosphatase
MHPLLNTALQAARAAGKQLLREFDRISSYQDERQIDLNEICSELETNFTYFLKEKYPSHTLLFNSQRPDKQTSSEDVIWIVDVLNGKTNYQRGIPYFAVCIAIFQNNKIEHALIYDPIMNEIFSGERNKQAQCNNFRMRIRENQSNKTVLIAGNTNPNPLDQRIEKIQTGSNALMLAYTAAGRYDAFAGKKLTYLEAAIGTLLIKAAGGMSTDFEGGDTILEKQELLGSNLKFLKVLLQKASF